MSSFSSEEYARGVVRTVQIIVAALAMGLIIFAGIVMSLRLNQPAQPLQDKILQYFAIGFAVVMLAARRVIGSSTVARHRRNIAAGKGLVLGRGGVPLPAATDGDRLLFVFQQKTIIESAMVEGPAFFTVVVYLITGEAWLLGIAAVLLAVLIVPFPTFDRVAEWVKYQLELIELEKR
jgi:hypothetical protein